MANIFDGFLKQLATGDSVKDYKHASKLFVDNNYALSPKYDWLYHVFFDVSELSTYASQTNELTEAGMLVKRVSLPTFAVDTKRMNNYNRKELVQTKLQYPAINIVFHDDQSDVVRHFWVDYLAHYYRDLDMGYSDRSGTVDPSYKSNQKYRPGERDKYNNFGFSPRNTTLFGTPDYLHAVRIYSLHQKQFSEYTLLNPVITNFSHGEHASGNNGALEHTMTIEFNTVLYATGSVNNDNVTGFADLHYDKSPSPLTPAGGGTNSILGPGGIFSAVDSVVGQAGKGSLSGLGGALFTTLRAFQTNENLDFKGAARSELTQAFKDVLNGKDPKDRFFVPTAGGLANSSGVIDVANSFAPSPVAENTGVAGIASNGETVNFTPGSFIETESLATPVTGQPSVAPGTTLLGTNTTTSGSIAGTDLNKNLTFAKTASGGVQAVSTKTSSQFTGFSGAISQIAKDMQEKSQLVADQSFRSTTGTSVISSGALPFSASRFVSGTNNIVGQSSNVLSLTPFANKITQAIEPTGFNNIQAATNLAGSEAQKFIISGNKTDLAFGQRIATSTNPAPTQSAGIDLGGSIPT